jgi:hypothetical protein
MPKLVLNIPRVPKSPNALRGRHWTVKHKDRNSWVTEIWVACFKEGLCGACTEPKRTTKKKKVVIAVYSASQPMDPDNLDGSRKPILDAMKANGLLVDDSGKWCESTITQHKSTRKLARTEISIEDC